MKIHPHSFSAALLLSSILIVPSYSPAGVLDGALWFEREVGSGVVWRYYQFDSLFGSKQSISYMEVDLSDPSVSLDINYRNGAVGPSPALFPRTLTSNFANETVGAKAAINGTYFNTGSYDVDDPTAVWGGGTTFLRVDGTTVHTFDGVNVNNHGMAMLFNSKTDLQIARRPGGGWAGLTDSWTNMMASGPVLLENGVVETYAPSNTHATARHPRSAVGITNTNKLILMAVDGRTSDAVGMSCTELATVMLDLGCDDAINLDGGGSTTLWAAGEPYSGVVNYPSDNSAYDHAGQRSCANALIIVAGNATPVQWDGRLTNLSYDPLSRSAQTMTVTATYTNLGTETWTTSNVRIAPSRAFGRTSAFVPTGQETGFFTMNPSSVATGQTATFTISLTPPTVAVDTFREEDFVLWHITEGWFGPADNELRIRTTVRPPLSGAPPATIVQGGPSAPNNQWYTETGTWGSSSVSFSAPGVADGGTQRYISAASTTGRSATFRPTFDVPGIYRVEAAFPSSTNSVSAQYSVNHLEGSNSVTLNQITSAGLTNQWNQLGQYQFGTGTTKADGIHSVVVSPAITGNRIYSGAIRFDYVGPLPGSVADWMTFD